MSQKAGQKSRGNGEGNIRQRKDGRWEARITIGRNENGTQKMKYFYGKSRKEAAEKLEAYNNDTRKGIYIEPNKYTLSQWIDEWYKTYVVNRVKPTTQANYHNITNIYIKPYLGQIKLMELKSAHVQEFYNSLLTGGRINGNKNKGFRSSSIQCIHKVLRTLLQAAYLNDLIPKNPVSNKRVTLPKKEQDAKVNTLTPAEQKKIEKLCVGTRFGTAIILDLYTGLRRGELLALTWNDVDFKNRTLTVNKQLNRLRNFDSNSTTKTSLTISNYTKSSVERKIALPSAIIEMLENYKDNEIKNRQSLGGLYSEHNLIFCYENGEPLDINVLPRFFKKLLKKAKIKSTKFHTIRHTFATRALEAGVPVKVVSQILGHANISITLDTYSHVLSELQDEAMQTITDKFLSI